jgi:glycosyltransferase involved in cell wall biosynthesis
MKVCIVIPHYDHIEQFRIFLPKLVTLGLPLVVVDDGSPGSTVDELVALLQAHASGAILIRHTDNRGKGGAVMTGLRSALEAGFSHALQIDADGQHDISNVPIFLQAASSQPARIICGQPVFNEDVSRFRYRARYVTLFLCYLETLCNEIRDAMCGFRLYPLQEVVGILDQCRPGAHMAFDPEILVRAVWAGIRLRYIPIRVSYPEGGKSHFHYFSDNLEISWMHARLLIGMLIRVPQLIRQNRDRRHGELMT